MAILSTRAVTRGALHRLAFRITGMLIAFAADLPLHASPATLPVLVGGRLLFAWGGRLGAWIAARGTIDSAIGAEQTTQGPAKSRAHSSAVNESPLVAVRRPC